MFSICFFACRISFKFPYWLGCLNLKRMTLSQTVRQMMDNLQKSKLFLRPWEKEQPCPEGTKQQVSNISETHKLRRKTWAKQDTRQLNYFEYVPVKGIISWSRRALKAFFFFFWSTVELCSAITSPNCLGAIRLRIMTDKPLEWGYSWIS